MSESPRKNDPSSPSAIAKKAAAMPWKENARVDLFPYEKAILALRERGYSYGEVAAWLEKEISAPVKRGQVYYVCQQLAAEAHDEFDAAEAKGKVRYLPLIKLTPEEAERAAADQDQDGAGGGKKKGGKK
jgi:hypothetical protein